MTQLQDSILDKIEALVMQLALSDKQDKAKGEINDISKAIRETRNALSK